MFNKEKKTNLNFLSSQPTGILVFENGLKLQGIGLGHEGYAVGEVCFNTSMTGYQEIITDPSYSDQIINFTFPHIGNVGTNLEDIESEKIWLKGVVFAKEITDPSNYRSFEKLDFWLKRNSIVGIAGLDTRMITNLIRKNGAVKATIVNNDKNLNDSKYLNECKNWPGLKGMELTSKVTTKQIYQWNDESFWKRETGYQKNLNHKTHVVVMDFGCKKNILRNFSKLETKLTIVPSDTSFDKIKELKPDGVFLSNGPGDPAETYKIINQTLKSLLESNYPIFGICLGHQLLALAGGAKTFKMKFGHHGANHPVQEIKSKEVFITSQNHGFAVDPSTLPTNIVSTHISLFDNTLQGIEFSDRPAFSFQGHPEASPGPQEIQMLFKKFKDMVEDYAKT